MKLLVVIWFLAVYAPHWWLASYGLTPVLKLPLLLYLCLAGMLVLTVPTSKALAQRWQSHVPFLLFIGLGWLGVPFTTNSGVAREALIQLSLFWLLITATVTIIDTPRRAEQLLLLYALQYLWWGLLGSRTGMVPWHPGWANYDGYGAMLVGGVGVCWFFYHAAPKGWFRRGMLLALGLSAMGIVASFARGAFLGAMGLFGIVWFRSTHKGKTFVTGAGTVLVMVVAAAILHPGTFWAEIQSTFTEGTTSGTGEDRWILWGAGVEVWREHPFFGVGPANFGPFAAGHFQVGELEGPYGRNPGRLYERSLHSVWVQLLCERGLVGLGLFLWVLVDFWKRNTMMRRPEVRRAWREGGGRLELGHVALALEGSMVAFIITGAFYPLLTSPWLFSLLALNLMLHGLAVRNHAVLRALQQGASAGPVRPMPGTGGGFGPVGPRPSAVPPR